MKFKPKVPQPKKSKAAAPKKEAQDDVDDKELVSKLIAQRSANSLGRSRQERKVVPAQVAFGQGSSSIRSFGNPQKAFSDGKPEDDTPKPMKEYVEPWDYVRSFYPTTLPLRRPYSGDPEILDKDEFGEDAMTTAQRYSVPPAQELGLMEDSIEPQMFLFQLPAALPLAKEPPAAADSEESESAKNGSKPNVKKPVGCSLKDLPSGFIGKMLIYKSGKVKMKIGDALFDVSPGQDCAFAQDAAVIDMKEKHCCVLGDLHKRVMVTPDVDSLLDAIEKM